MKRAICILVTFAVLVCGCIQDKDNADFKFPKSIGYVNDFEKVLSHEEVAELNKLISDYYKATTNQIAIVSVDSISPYTDIRTFAKDLGNEWGVGQKDKDNGLIIVFSEKLRQIFIATGLGTQKTITDSICNDIIHNSILPEFKNARFAEGLKKGIQEIIKRWGK